MEDLEMNIEKIDIWDFLKKFFSLKKGVRCRVIHRRCNGNEPFLYSEGRMGFNLINEFEVDDIKDLHFFEFIFDENVMTDEIERKNYISKYRIGISPVMDIDAPTIDDKRADFFNYVNDFEIALDIVDKEMEEVGLKYNVMFSGNGLYVIGESMYIDEYDDFWLAQENFLDMIDDINEFVREKGSKVEIDSRMKGWNRYYRAPFSYHCKSKRYVIPLFEWDNIW